MKVAISATSNDIKGNVDDVFGRCKYFIIVEINNKIIENVESFENLSAQKAGGAGISAAQNIAEKKVDTVITINIGPRALEILEQFDINIYKGVGQVEEVLQKLIEEKLEKIK